MVQNVKRKGLLPVLGAIAEALLPAQPDKAALAKSRGQEHEAAFHAMSGKHQTKDIQQASLPCCCDTEAQFLC